MYVCMYVCIHVCMYVCMYVCPQLTKIACQELTCLYQFNVQARSLRVQSLTIARNYTWNEKGDGKGVKKVLQDLST